MKRKPIFCPITECDCENENCSKTRCVAEPEVAARAGAAEFEANRMREARIVTDWVRNPDSANADEAMEILLRTVQRMGRP